MIKMKKQAGLSLFWVAVLMASISFAAVAALFAMRYERNLFAEAWSGLVKSSGAAETIKKSQQALAGTVKNESTALRKCVVNGQVMYSNVECDTKSGNTRLIKVSDSQGFEAPRLPPKEDAAPSEHNKMMDKAIEKATR